MNYTELADFSDEKLIHTELQLERNLIAARFRHYTSQLEDHSVLKKLRRDIARLQTAVRERERDQELPKNALRGLHASTFKPESGEAGVVEGASGFLKGIVDKVSSKE
jgi:ribosomal protein L29